jgi:CheY-like chemotaxis protein
MSGTQPRTVAVVDDDRLLRTVLADVLSEAGFRVELYGSAEEALPVLSAHPVDAVVADLLLPRMNGLELMRRLRGHRWAKRTPFVAVSALEWPAHELESVKPSLTLKKPFDARRFAAQLKRMLSPEGRRRRDHTSPTRRLDLQSGATPRFPLRFRSAFELIRHYSQSLARGTIVVSCPHPPSVGTAVELDLRLPHRDGHWILPGRVQQSVSEDSPDAQGEDAGMVVALDALPETLHRELHAFLAGFREGTAYAELSRPLPVRVVLIGIQGALDSDEMAFLRRAEFQPLWVDSVDEIPDTEEGPPPRVWIVHYQVLGARPRAALEQLRDSVQCPIVVYGAQLGLLDPRFPEAPTSGQLRTLLLRQLSLGERRWPRKRLTVPVDLKRVDGPIPAALEDVSLSGLSVITQSPCAVGEQLEVSFQLPAGMGTVSGRAHVRRGNATAPHVYRVGAHFDELPPASMEALRRYLTTPTSVRPLS